LTDIKKVSAIVAFALDQGGAACGLGAGDGQARRGDGYDLGKTASEARSAGAQQ
jgi:hypothetical protein